ncbi:MAG: MurR/RpiR family transcriptional regulator [Defluviitaleaceae bacterium]|nr:MurR/RpiR family transcriptional regulator [Defluviitaleaceae bacterium]MCL2273728.1 MurR/RpiR family transcriptional regulator [Defluviitaleaceae bacterium]
MTNDFYQVTQYHLGGLTQTEQQLYDYVVKNMDTVKDMNIRRFAAAHFISTTTVFRFTRKLGFVGYAEFLQCIRLTAFNPLNTQVPRVNLGRAYAEEYLKNAMEAVRVMPQPQVQEVVALLKKKPSIYILTDDNTHAIGQYCERLFIGLGFHAYFPETAYQLQNLANRIRNRDLLIALSYKGRDGALLDFIHRVFLTGQPHLLSITRADNNPLESLSDTNFYIFADEIRVPSMDITSSVPMLMVLELLVYEYMAASQGIAEVGKCNNVT